MSNLDLVAFWRRHPLEGPSYVHPDDAPILANAQLARETSFDEYVGSETFWEPDDSRLHVGLLPIPYTGDLVRASVFILMLNPGLSPVDYFAETSRADYREALRASVRQEGLNSEFPFLFLNPCFSWHPGFRYWERKLCKLASVWRSERATTYKEALAEVAQTVACVELVPYHSRHFHLAGRTLRVLPSAVQAQHYVQDHLIPRAQRNEVALIATRQARSWKLLEAQNIVVYNGSESRAAHLTPGSRGGALILEQLRRRFVTPA